MATIRDNNTCSTTEKLLRLFCHFLESIFTLESELERLRKNRTVAKILLNYFRNSFILFFCTTFIKNSAIFRRENFGNKFIHAEKKSTSQCLKITEKVSFSIASEKEVSMFSKDQSVKMGLEETGKL